MQQTILDLFTYPSRTIDRLLAEKNYVQANRIFFLTMVVVSLSLVLSLYLQQYKIAPISPWLITLVAIGPIGGLLFTRFLFRQLVKLGLLMVANQTYPSDPTERRERSQELYLLYPYHVVSLIIPAVVLPFVVAPTSGDSLHLLAKLVLMIGYLLLSWGTLVFQIAVMVMIVKRVYNVTAAQAFWGPMLAYFLFAVAAGFISVALALIITLAVRFLS
ncbi:hypothetical protein [Effusibacillus consociatus]|uniref:Yip1 domain-containing protein n=1 Tax=Effusibacillus consociatus TaxID=1117041 RepID=A0ABV9Q2X8_9BACL